MRKTTLERTRSLRTAAVDGPCLELDVEAIQPVWSGDGEDLLEGILRDPEDGTRYPVLGGVAILVPDPLAWLRARFPLVMAALANYGGISNACLDGLEKLGISNGNRLADDYYETARWVNIFTSAHYDVSPAGADDRSSIGRFLADQRQVFDVVTDLLAQHGGATGGRLLDVGCNVGGMAHRLATSFDEVLGIDACFHPVLAARRIQVGQPSAQDAYRRYIDGERSETREIRSPRTHADFVTGKLECLPFSGTFDVVVALNVIDVVPEPRIFLQALHDATSPGGLMVMTSPYSWGSDDTPMDRWIGGRDEASSEAVLQAVRETDFEILEDVDDVPWVLREHQRWYRVFLNHCIIARRSD